MAGLKITGYIDYILKVIGEEGRDRRVKTHYKQLLLLDEPHPSLNRKIDTGQRIGPDCKLTKEP